ncbi:MAG: hypothetical protein K0S39_1485 [Paenibacillus sp.]|nr:hypothetical protein [Paenibacillus sp.]
MDKPNIVRITTDSQRCMGSLFAVSPRLEKLASEGVLFEQGYDAAFGEQDRANQIISDLET